MGKYRKLPFGYRMERGRIVLDPVEAEWIVYIYEQYILGESFKSLADAMCRTGVHYDVDKQWNKNMVARILQDERYAAAGKFPQIIDNGLFLRADEKRRKKVTDCKLTKAQKILRKKCIGRMTPYIEQEVRCLLNDLTRNPEQIKIPNYQNETNSRVETLQAELVELLSILPVNEKNARQKLVETTVAMYEAIDPREYETYRLKRIFISGQVRTELDSALLEECVSEVTMDSRGRVRIRLKNDQIIERGECSE